MRRHTNKHRNHCNCCNTSNNDLPANAVAVYMNCDGDEIRLDAHVNQDGKIIPLIPFPNLDRDFDLVKVEEVFDNGYELCECFEPSQEEVEEEYNTFADMVEFPDDKYVDRNILAPREMECTYDHVLKTAAGIIRSTNATVLDKLCELHRAEMANLMEYVTSYSLLLAQTAIDEAVYKTEANK